MRPRLAELETRPVFAGRVATNEMRCFRANLRQRLNRIRIDSTLGRNGWPAVDESAGMFPKRQICGYVFE